MTRLFAIFVFAIACVFTLAANGAPADEEMRVETVTIVTDKGEFDFSTEIADIQPLREKGLMFRKTLAADHAMLFDWGRPQTAAMWMRNTYISLDMLFISSDGTVEYVAENTKPHSLDIVSAGIPVVAVLEVIAGTAKRIQLKRGDQVRHPIFSDR